MCTWPARAALSLSPAWSSPATRSVSAPSRGPRTAAYAGGSLRRRGSLLRDEWSILRVARRPVRGRRPRRGPAARKSPASPPPVAASVRERAIDGDDRRTAGVDGVDDLGVVDALEVDRGDAEVGVAELALDDDQRHAFACHLDRVGVAELVWSEAPAHTSPGRGASELRSCRRGRPGSAARRPVDDAEQRPDRKFD